MDLLTQLAMRRRRHTPDLRGRIRDSYMPPSVRRSIKDLAADEYEEPNFLERLASNPGFGSGLMDLGMAWMANASRPGASALGSLGESWPAYRQGSQRGRMNAALSKYGESRSTDLLAELDPVLAAQLDSLNAPAAPEPYTLGPGQARYEGNTEVAYNPALPESSTLEKEISYLQRLLGPDATLDDMAPYLGMGPQVVVNTGDLADEDPGYEALREVVAQQLSAGALAADGTIRQVEQMQQEIVPILNQVPVGVGHTLKGWLAQFFDGDQAKAIALYSNWLGDQAMEELNRFTGPKSDAEQEAARQRVEGNLAQMTPEALMALQQFRMRKLLSDQQAWVDSIFAMGREELEAQNLGQMYSKAAQLRAMYNEAMMALQEQLAREERERRERARGGGG